MSVADASITATRNPVPPATGDHWFFIRFRTIDEGLYSSAQPFMPEEVFFNAGSHPPYRWLTSSEQYIDTLVGLCPEILIDRHLVVTSIDSGDPWLTDNQKRAGWELRCGNVCSPRLATTDELFYQRDYGPGTPGWDEWYLFDDVAPDLGERLRGNPFEEATSPRPGRLMIFVGYPSLALHDPAEAENPIVGMFWRQLDWIKPESYIADGRDCLTFVSRNAALFDTVHERLKAALSQAEAKPDA